MNDAMLATPEAAKLLGVSPSYLNQSRLRGDGPAFVKISPTCVRYRRTDLESWVASRTVRSTAEAGRMLAGSKAA
jgi:predicted DNA-binding transcriptional regulator AlpA